MLEKEEEYTGVSNKYQKLCNAYDIAIKNLFNELLSCASASTMNDACNNIRKLNYIDIINNAFEISFETPPVENEIKEQTFVRSSEETEPNLVNEEPKVVHVSDECAKELQKKISTEQIDEKVEKSPPANNFYERMRAMAERTICN